MTQAMIGQRLLLSALALSLATFVTIAGPARAATGDMSMMNHGRYLGTPDLPLLAAMLAAGGGAKHFHGLTLSAMLTAQHHDDEVASLTSRFGARRMTTYFATFDTFVDEAVAVAIAKHVALPRPNPGLAHNSYELAASLRAAGIMPDGRFDIGYFVEHLISRPIHKDVMDRVNADPKIGPAANGDFHFILTAEMNDLKSLYHLAQ